MNRDLLRHAEYVLENFVDDVSVVEMEDLNVVDLLDTMTMEEKLVADHQTSVAGLEPWEIAEIAQSVVNRIHPLPEHNQEDADLAFDTVYEAIAEALERAQR